MEEVGYRGDVDLLYIQKESYRDFLQPDVESEKERGYGLEDIFLRVFPINSQNNLSSLQYCSYHLEPSSYSEEECQRAKLTYGANLRLKVRLIVKEKNPSDKISEISEQEVFLGTIPLMTERATFVINGVEKTIISQLQRSPGVYFSRSQIGQDYKTRIIPARGIWLEIRLEGERLFAYLGKRKILLSTLLYAFESSKEEIASYFKKEPQITKIIEEDPVFTSQEAILQLYSLLRPGYPSSKKAASEFFHQVFYPPNYNLSEAGRLRLNRKLKINQSELYLTKNSLLSAISYLFSLYRGKGEVDDIDHLGNKRVRTVGELVGEKVEVGLTRLARLIKERMNFSREKRMLPQDLFNSRLFSSTVNDFFSRSQLSQFLEQTNPLAEITHKRRLTSIGERMVTERRRIGFEIRDIHYTHYGRICPIETPEGGNIGLITSLALYARIDPLGFLCTPYKKVVDGKVTEHVDYLRADEEDNYHMAPADSFLDKKGKFLEKEVKVRFKDTYPIIPAKKIDYIDFSPRQTVGLSASLIPFLEHDDANRALMGSNMQRQALPLIKPEPPLVKTGMERLLADPMVIRAKEEGVVSYIDAEKIVVQRKKKEIFSWDNEDVYYPERFKRLNQDTVFHQRPVINRGNVVKKGEILTDAPAISKDGELSLGRNLLVAFLPWEGYNFEDAIIISEKLVKEDSYTSIHIKEFSIETHETDLGNEEITRDIPNISEDLLKNLDENGITRIGSMVKHGDILIGKITPRGETEFTPEERLLRVIFGEKAREVRNSSRLAPPGTYGTVVDIQKLSQSIRKKSDEEIKKEKEKIEEIGKRFEEEKKRYMTLVREKISVLSPNLIKNQKPSIPFFKRILRSLSGKELKKKKDIEKVISMLFERLKLVEENKEKEVNKIRKGDKLPSSVLCRITVKIAVKKKVSVGDKLSGRHGNKGVISKILPEEDMPYLKDGTPVEIILNPLGVPSRMNVGQILETHLGWAAKTLGFSITTPVFGNIKEEKIREFLKRANLPENGKVALFNGRTGEKFHQKVTVGYIYMMKLYHLADEKIHARSVGPYSLITQQPLGGRAQLGGQRFGEMEVWALEGYGASHTLQEMLTVKSDDVSGRKRVYENIVKGKEHFQYSTPESFNVLVNELKGLCFNVGVEKRKENEVVSIKVVSPETILSWSNGEVKKPETINYRTFKPEKDGLFCERIFGPVKDWECACGKYKKKRYRGITCDRCGVELTTSDVRRVRFGHIKLPCPVSYIWLFKSASNWLGLLLEIPSYALESIIYFERYVVIDSGNSPYQKHHLLSENDYQEAVKKYSGLLVGIGADGIKQLLKRIDLKSLETSLSRIIKKSSRGNRKNLIKRLQMAQGLLKTGVKPEWLVTDVIPVIPPDLRPLLSLEGGRFATSDLNDLYQRVINRSNRLKKLLKLKAPQIIIRNEKRMLQEAVDSLFDNGRHGSPVLGKGNRPLKSLSDALRGKQGRFRQNLLGKRVDYSGRAVIVVGPELKLNECGIPKNMALELFAPFILRELRKREYVHTIGSAKKALERNDPVVWEILEEVVKNHPVFLNRQPTLHRLSVQAFLPRLIEGNVIRLHPLVCQAFNADFDGDQMAVHLPLSTEAQVESLFLMNSATHIFSPANGKPIVAPTRDIILGCSYLTISEEMEAKERYSGIEEVLAAYYYGKLSLHKSIKVKINGSPIETTAGRIIFNEILPSEISFKNKVVEEASLSNLIKEIWEKGGYQEVIPFLDRVKELGFSFATRSGLSISIEDLLIPSQKESLIKRAEEKVERFRKSYREGIITERERYHKMIDLWSDYTNKISDLTFKNLRETLFTHPFQPNPIFLMVDSGARGNRQQVAQLMGMRGLMSRPMKRITGGIGEIIESPVISNFREGLTILEYFISTHGGRKGLVDTALKTSDAGYLSRRLVDVTQDVVITEEDCGTIDGILVSAVWQGDRLLTSLRERIVGRTVLNSVVDLVSDEVIVRANEVIDENMAEKIEKVGIEKIAIRSVLTCKAERGICQKCYGWSLATQKMVEIGEAVGIVAAQSIGEPGTQLTLRTFHIGGIASKIVGESKVESRRKGLVKLKNLDKVIVNSKNERIILNRNGEVSIYDYRGRETEKYTPPAGAELLVKEGERIDSGTPLFHWDPHTLPLIAEKRGKVFFKDIEKGETVKEEYEGAIRRKTVIEHKESLTPILLIKDKGKVINYHHLPVDAVIMIKENQTVFPGDILAKIPRQVGRVQDITGGLPRVSELFEAQKPKDPAIISEISGIVEININEKSERVVKVTSSTGTEKSYTVPLEKRLLVREGDNVSAGEKLTIGSVVLNDILNVGGEKRVQEHLLSEIQEVYRLEGVNINDKHMEIIIRQMLSNVKIEDSGDTLFLEGEEVSKSRLQKENEKIRKKKEKPAVWKPLISGISRVALKSSSFISAASFQETTRVITDAAVMGQEDPLLGIKENVILGRLIPAGVTFPGFRKEKAEAKAEKKEEHAYFKSIS